MASAAAWTAARAIIEAAVTVPLVFANEGQQTPDADLFVQITGRSGDSGPSEMGRNPLWTEAGALECLIHGRVGTGSLSARQLADSIVAAFRTAAVFGIEWTGWQLDEASDAATGLFWVLALTIRYRLTTAVTP